MAKDKEFERQYKEEGRRRIARRKEKRNSEYRRAINKASEYGAPLYAVRHNHGWSNSWPDSNSPTGYSQICSYQGICQSPCNGDC